MNDIRFHDIVDVPERLGRILGRLEERGVNLGFHIPDYLGPIEEVFIAFDDLRSEHAILSREVVELRGQLAETRANLAAIVERDEQSRRFEHMTRGLE